MKHNPNPTTYFHTITTIHIFIYLDIWLFLIELQILTET